MTQPTIGRLKRLGDDEADSRNSLAAVSESGSVSLEDELPVVAPLKEVENAKKPAQRLPVKTQYKRSKLRLRGKDYSHEDMEIEGEPCPSCGRGLQDEAVICLNCGFNLKSGKKIKVEKSAVPRFSGMADANKTPKEKVDFLAKLQTLLIFAAVTGAVAFALVHFKVITSGPLKGLVDNALEKFNSATEPSDVVGSE